MRLTLDDYRTFSRDAGLVYCPADDMIYPTRDARAVCGCSARHINVTQALEEGRIQTVDSEIWNGDYGWTDAALMGMGV